MRCIFKIIDVIDIPQLSTNQIEMFSQKFETLMLPQCLNCYLNLLHSNEDWDPVCCVLILVFSCTHRPESER